MECGIIRSEEVHNCISYVREPQFQRIVPTPEAEAAWTQHVAEAGSKILRTQANSWFVGANIPGKPRFLLTSPDSAPVMRAKRAEVTVQTIRDLCCSSVPCSPWRTAAVERRHVGTYPNRAKSMASPMAQ